MKTQRWTAAIGPGDWKLPEMLQRLNRNPFEFQNSESRFAPFSAWIRLDAFRRFCNKKMTPLKCFSICFFRLPIEFGNRIAPESRSVRIDLNFRKSNHSFIFRLKLSLVKQIESFESSFWSKNKFSENELYAYSTGRRILSCRAVCTPVGSSNDKMVRNRCDRLYAVSFWPSQVMVLRRYPLVLWSSQNF